MIRPVVTGIGAVTPLGNTFLESWKALVSGRSGIAPLTRVDASRLRWKVAGEVRGFNALEYLTEREARRLDPFIHYSCAAAFMAIQDAGLLLPGDKGGEEGMPPMMEYLSLGGVVIGSSRGGVSSMEQAFAGLHDRKENSRVRRVSPFLMPATTIGMASSYVAQRFGFKGFTLGVSNACASGSNAIGEAFRLIKNGYPGPVIAGGTEAPLCWVCLAGYGSAGALSRRADATASRPFDRGRDGFVLSEGACLLVIESLDRAMERGATIHGEIAGYGNITDGTHLTRPDRNGAARAMSAALTEANLSAREIDFISAHGTSTPAGDEVESEAIGMVFGEQAARIPVSAFKSVSGHMLAASGAFEIAASLRAMRDSVIPPTANLTDKDPACALNLSAKKRKGSIKAATSNSFGFGGVNTSIVVRSLAPDA